MTYPPISSGNVHTLWITFFVQVMHSHAGGNQEQANKPSLILCCRDSPVFRRWKEKYTLLPADKTPQRCYTGSMDRTCVLRLRSHCSLRSHEQGCDRHRKL